METKKITVDFVKTYNLRIYKNPKTLYNLGVQVSELIYPNQEYTFNAVTCLENIIDRLKELSKSEETQNYIDNLISRLSYLESSYYKVQKLAHQEGNRRIWGVHGFELRAAGLITEFKSGIFVSIKLPNSKRRVQGQLVLDQNNYLRLVIKKNPELSYQLSKYSLDTENKEIFPGDYAKSLIKLIKEFKIKPALPEIEN